VSDEEMTISADTFERLLTEVAMGRGVKTICRDDPGMPHYTTVTKRCQNDPEFAEALAQAREMQAAYLFDDVVENLERIRDGKIEAKSATAWMNGIKMIAEKLAARKYGPRVSNDHTSSDGSMSPKESGKAVLDALSRKHADN